ncbi:Probable ATP-dependent transporter SufC [Candidatus Providencia siddallii]|uniref:Probable ATP-dependent transporter SufC n=1 Tax=Candidatus Providencia siddallii TaxID=1715285 RepID=A0A0M6W7N7_9GAMM|nr:Probable ATP-dependent transporter SufC [Candidatus Providencia siddallii]
MLNVKDLHVTIDNNNILKGLSIKIKNGEIHAIMGPNGSGKSTFSGVLAGRKEYKIKSGKILFKGKNLFDLTPEERACEGIFSAFQYPIELPGISNYLFLQTAVNSVRKYRNQKLLERYDFQNFINNKINLLQMPKDLLTRCVNVGFSGGEKKRNDILQMAVLEPQLCILDETDSGLDIDALKIVSKCINSLRTPERSFVIITHYQRILNYIQPDFVHILYQGKIVKSGDFSLAKTLEEHGYDWLTKQQ